MRSTLIRHTILAFLAAQHVPVNLEAVTQAEGVRGCCNATTAYRTLILLKELEVIRQVSLPDKNSYFLLNAPGESNPFLICRRCGQITKLPAMASVAKLERAVAATQGYAGLYHQLEFFGVCPACQKLPRGVVCAKVQPRKSPRAKPKPVLVRIK